MSEFRDSVQAGMKNAEIKAGKGRVLTYNPATGGLE
jgi:hypothetical protein